MLEIFDVYKFIEKNSNCNVNDKANGMVICQF